MFRDLISVSLSVCLSVSLLVCGVCSVKPGYVEKFYSQRHNLLQIPKMLQVLNGCKVMVYLQSEKNKAGQLCHRWVLLCGGKRFAIFCPIIKHFGVGFPTSVTESE